jgi:hypothetical protein
MSAAMPNAQPVAEGVGMLSPVEFRAAPVISVAPPPPPGDSQRFDESQKIEAFIQGLRGGARMAAPAPPQLGFPAYEAAPPAPSGPAFGMQAFAQAQAPQAPEAYLQLGSSLRVAQQGQYSPQFGQGAQEAYLQGGSLPVAPPASVQAFQFPQIPAQLTGTPGLNRWANYFSAENDSIRARDQR